MKRIILGIVPINLKYQESKKNIFYYCPPNKKIIKKITKLVIKEIKKLIKETLQLYKKRKKEVENFERWLKDIKVKF